MLVAFGFTYVLLFAGTVLSLDPGEYALVPIFTEAKFVIPLILTTLLAFMDFGKILVISTVEDARSRCLRDIYHKEEDLISYVKLAQAVTKDNATDIVKQYISVLEKQHLPKK